jgi:hypothetical protein
LAAASQEGFQGIDRAETVNGAEYDCAARCAIALPFQELAMRPNCFALMLWLCVCSLGRAADPAPIELREPGTNLFADSKVECAFHLKAPADFKGRLTWAFASANDRVFNGGRGERAVAGKGAEAAVVRLTLTTPAVNPGVVLETRLSVALVADGADKPDATLTTTLWIFPPDPFVNRRQWLKDFDIVVFDANKKSKTAEAFEALKIPHVVVRDVGQLGDRNAGLIVVGEGASFKEERGLAEALAPLARRGCQVVCLAASEGSVPLPGAGADGNPPASVTFQRQAIIRQLDKRLDPQHWGGKGPLLTHSLHLAAKDGDVIADVQDNAKGWPWLQADFAGGGKLIFCEFALLKHWDASPTPRYLFARMLESLSPTQAAIEPK